MTTWRVRFRSLIFLIYLVTLSVNAEGSSERGKDPFLKSPAHYTASEIAVLGMTFFFDRYSNYVEKSPIEQWYARWLLEDPPKSSARGLASTVEQIDPGTGGRGNSKGAYQENSAVYSDEAAYEAWKTQTYQRIRSSYIQTYQGNASQVGSVPQNGSSRSRTLSPDKVPLDAADGYKYYQNLVIQCMPDYQPGDSCMVVGERDDFEIIGLEGGKSISSRIGDGRMDGLTSPGSQNQVPQTSHETRDEMARSNPVVSTSYISRNAVREQASAPAISSEQLRRSLETFNTCQEVHRRALRLCGSSSQRPDRDFVLEKLKIVAPSHYANYLTYVRQLNSQSGDFISTCQATEQVANSMTALNVDYEMMCMNAREHCASECYTARAQNLEINEAQYIRAREQASSCERDMTRYASSGLFDHSEASRMLASANSCKEKIATLGPCSVASQWDTAQCQRHCKDPQNSALPACVRYKAMNSNCSIPEFAAQNSFCRSLSSSREIARSPSQGERSSSGFTIPQFSGKSAGSFGGSKDTEPTAATNPSKSPEQMKAEVPRNTRPIYVTQNSQEGPHRPTSTSSESNSFTFVMKLTDGFRNFLGFGAVRPKGAYSRTAVSHGGPNSAQRSISSEKNEPEFNLAKYVFRTETGPGGQMRCYRGAERLLCPEQDIFHAISRKYRSLKLEMKE